MMKWSFAIHALIGGVLVVPALTLAGGGGQDLSRSLDDTVHALELLSGIEKRVQAHAPEASQLVREATEAPIAQGSVADQHLDELRREVGRLQMIHDAGQSNVASGTAPLFFVPTGMPEATRVALGGNPTPNYVKRAAQPAPSDATVKAADSIEESGFSADPLRQAQACFRAARFEQALDVLKGHLDDPRARYWSARALEKLGRTDEALVAYKLVVDAPTAGDLVQRAKTDMEFLEWKQRFAPRASGPQAQGERP
jgi:hypothetical protein